MTITSLDGYRWLKNDIIRGNPNNPILPPFE